MKIGVLTSSRADYGIYKPLLDDLKNDVFFQLEIISFGTHLSKKYGYTISDIISDNYKVIHKVCEIGNDDSQKGVVQSYGSTILKFSEFWNNNKYDIVLCLGDRFEMSAAIQASIPFNVNLGHIHGGETTLGAIDNTYRHQITIASKYHFVSTELNKSKVKELTGIEKNIYNIGSLSLSEIENFKPVNKNDLFSNFKIPNAPFVLVTFHPETIAIEKNNEFSVEMRKALEYLSRSINIVITMPNADTLGSLYRKQLLSLKESNINKVCLVENFGKENYFSAMYYSRFLIGNTSSGIIEAASFSKYVLNIGERQKGRSQSNNTFNAIFTKSDIIENALKILSLGNYEEDNIYFKKGSSKQIINILKNERL
jgi:GDP/UDP-N,N'-diacetylbacillosamine 2-epimerase (hydrolysing)